MEATKTLEQLRAEAEAAQAALAEAQRAERQAKEEAERAARQAKYEEQQRIERAKRQAVSERVLAALLNAGIGNEGAELVNVEFAYQKVSSYRSVPTGYVVTVRTVSGPARRFPVKPDGSFNTPKIVAAVNEYISIAKAAKARKAEEDTRKASGAELASRLNAEFGGDRAASAIGYHLPTGSSRSEYREAVASPGKVFLKLGNRECTEEQARIVLEALNRAFPRS